MIPHAVSLAEKELGVFDFYGGYSYNGIGNDITINLKYLISKNTVQGILKKAEEIVAELITEDMTEYQKEKSLSYNFV